MTPKFVANHAEFCLSGASNEDTGVGDLLVEVEKLDETFVEIQFDTSTGRQYLKFDALDFLKSLLL